MRCRHAWRERLHYREYLQGTTGVAEYRWRLRCDKCRKWGRYT